MRRTILGLISSMVLSQAVFAQFMQQGAKLVGISAIGSASQGCSVAISGDGNTALVGGSTDNENTGAVWVFTRTGGVWTERAKLVASAMVGKGNLSQSLAISVDGKTAVIGSPYNNSRAGSVLVFTRVGEVWTQQAELVGTGAVWSASQGTGVAVSADGVTIVIGAANDNSDIGATWVFVRSGATWVQQGEKLVGSGAVGLSQQGWSVAISHEGNTILVGGRNDNDATGAAWIFNRSAGVWTQQGSKLVASDGVGKPYLGFCVSLASDGNTALIGGPYDNGYAGAAWVFTRSGGVWTQQGNRLVGKDRVGNALQGWSVSISGDGNTAIVGAANDNGNIGASWVYNRWGGNWVQLGSKLVGTACVGQCQQGRSIALSASGKTAIVGASKDDDSAGAAWIFTAPIASIYLAGISHSFGVPPTFWKSRYEVHNRGTTQAQYSVALLPRDQENLNPLSVNLQLDPGRTVYYSDVLGSMFTYSGPATLRTNVASGDLIVSARTFNDQPTGTYGQYIPGLSDDKAVHENQEVRLVLLSYSTASGSGFRTNLGVVSACGIPITVTIDLYAGSGVLLGTRTFALEAYESKQETNSFSKVTVHNIEGGFAKVKSTTPGARYFAYASVVDNRTGDPIHVWAQ